MKKYTLQEYADLLQQENMIVSYAPYDKSASTIDYLTFNSKETVSGTLFICKGATFKEEYLEEALSRGADFYISDKEYPKFADVPHITVKDIRKAMPLLANMYDNYPWKDINITAVGGTKGKTTTVFFLKGIADTYLAANGNKECGLMSTMEIFDGVEHKPTRRTTPEAVELQHILRRCVDNDIKRLCMEVSSQGFKYDRVAGMGFDMSIFLNIGEDHISPNEHSDFDDYLNSKLMMFGMSDKTVVNMDMDFAERVLEASKAASQVFTFSLKNKDADYFAYNIHKENHDTVFSLKGTDFDETFKISIPGLFNVENAVAAIVASYENGIPIKYIKEGIYGANAEGRMEMYSSQDGKLLCIVDYAHNGFSFERLFSSVKTEYPNHHIVAVFGVPGGKAYGRRKETGEVAGKYADQIILTADDPANEKVSDICEQIAQHIPSETPYTIIEDREEAVKQAVLQAKPDSVIVVTGKGSETNQAVGNGYVDCLSDAEAINKYLKEYNESH